MSDVDFGGEPCTAVKTITHDGREETLFFAKQTGLLLGIEKAEKYHLLFDMGNTSIKET